MASAKLLAAVVAEVSAVQVVVVVAVPLLTNSSGVLAEVPAVAGPKVIDLIRIAV